MITKNNVNDYIGRKFKRIKGAGTGHIYTLIKYDDEADFFNCECKMNNGKIHNAIIMRKSLNRPYFQEVLSIKSSFNVYDRIKFKNSEEKGIIVKIKTNQKGSIYTVEFDNSFYNYEVDYNLSQLEHNFEKINPPLNPNNLGEINDGLNVEYVSLVDNQKECDLISFPRYNQNNKTNCECGIDSVGGGLHSSWCPKHEVN